VLFRFKRGISMNIWIIVVTLFVDILILAVIVNWVVEYRSGKQERKKRKERKWLQQHGKRIVAYVTNAIAQQGWKYEDKFHWNRLQGRNEQVRTWQTFYSITATWMEPQTKLNYTFGFDVWADDLTSKPAIKSAVLVVFDPWKPDHYYADLKMS
jgi:DNA modification methylase